MNKIKLFHIISRIDIGGVERQLLSLVANLDKEKYDICVGYFEGKGELEREFQDTGIKTKKFKFIGLWDISIWRRLYQDMKANRYDIVHTHGFKADLYGAVFGKLAGVPVIISTVHNQEQYLKNPIIRLLEKWIISPIDDTIIVVSEGVKRFLIKTCGIPEGKIKKVYYGINPVDIKIDKSKDIRAEFDIDKDGILIGCIGRLVEQKGHKYLIRAAKRVIEKIPEAKFLIVGRGKLEKDLRNLADRLNLDSGIIFTGFRENVYSIIDKLNLIVMPSLWEGFGLVLLEAMTLGKPIVATDVGGIPEVVRDKEEGILVSPQDPKALAEAIILLLEDQSLASRLGETGKLAVRERFSVARMVEEVELIYNKGARICTENIGD